jgi:hypothetical protein
MFRNELRRIAPGFYGGTARHWGRFGRETFLTPDPFRFFQRQPPLFFDLRPLRRPQVFSLGRVRHDILVLKFGSSVLKSREDPPAVVHEIYRWYRDGWRVVAVVSAIGEATEQLLKDARQVSADPEPLTSAALLATGERQSAALLAMALDRVDVPARLVDPRAIGLTAAGSALDSKPVDVDGVVLATLLNAFRAHRAWVLRLQRERTTASLRAWRFGPLGRVSGLCLEGESLLTRERR